MRADLHVHTVHSGSRYYRRAGLRDAYATPEQVYDAAKAAGMDLVTITDIDTIDGCLALLSSRGDLGDFLIGEEVEASIPGSSLGVHLNVWGIDESRHVEISRLKSDVFALAEYLKAAGIAAAFNHFVGALPVSIPSAGIYRRILALFDAMEVRNGGQGRHYNGLVAGLGAGEASRRSPVAFVGGSDAHTLRRVGTTWTEATARTREEFLSEIRAGRTAAGGRVGRARDVVFDLVSLTLSHYQSLGSSLRPGGGRRNGGRGWAAALRKLPAQIIGVPLVGTVVHFARVRSQVRSLQREIGALDLRDFRERMSGFPRAGDEG